MVGENDVTFHTKSAVPVVPCVYSHANVYVCTWACYHSSPEIVVPTGETGADRAEKWRGDSDW